jgi:acetyltransferase-like isoleucine patch superfamily enzyme
MNITGFELILYTIIVIILIHPVFFIILTLPFQAYYYKKKDIIHTNNSHFDHANQRTEISNKSNYKQYVGGFIRYSIIKIGFIPSHHIRNYIYINIMRMKLSDDVVIYYGAELRKPYNITIGKGSILGDKIMIGAEHGVVIGENVNFSSNVQIHTEQHDYNDPEFKCNSTSDFKVIINNRVWIGPNVIILPGVTIGEGAVVAAGAVVTKDIPPFTLFGGIPAKKIGERNKILEYKFNGVYVPFL